ncbi:Histidinol-phosphate aminotransferase/Tyrosine aminotransferase [Caldanaerobacter subterraneus subsp. tengcongensis MB4]|uniref:Putative threonine-phosphate decarboxylase n=2 Tax=Caldanaerobacter subterraneus TaxID=911092 RepID=COBD_CALS4|nr:RecName: Full=Putative threonine-phosphate decarboxylase; AltName: Full=L-threonine-O-3-phosphate decarboxylase [Caldanaerobacter subterraneus subsp. tengcongensis MB4]AAM23667.1 Histidinol-phosphate aminotransferase/Tyrosine aminotransferase [Caldanaerobacter subterraneus subsp. tengcongensis MB4]
MKEGEKMKPYEHGGNIYDYQGNLIDFSSNINPLGPPEWIWEAIKEVDLSRYPDIKYRRLKEAIAEYVGCDRENIIVGNGAAELIHLFARAFKLKKPLIPSPSFLEYERAVKLNGGEPVYLKLEEEEGFRVNFAKVISKIEEADGLILGNPNNPTGQGIIREEIGILLKKAELMNIPVLIDEAFIEFMKDYKKYEALPLVKKHDKLFVVRAVTKFFGMPGIRLGYGIGSPSLIQKLEEYKEPWTVNAFAEAVGRWLFKDREYIEKTREYVNAEIEHMLFSLRTIDYLVAFDTKVNFILLKLKAGTVDEVKEKLLKKGILIRDASNFRYLDKRFFRVAVKRREDNMCLIEALRGLYEEGVMPDKERVVV